MFKHDVSSHGWHMQELAAQVKQVRKNLGCEECLSEEKCDKQDGESRRFPIVIIQQKRFDWRDEF